MENNLKQASIAQLVEQLTFNQLVAGSNPAGCTFLFYQIISDKSWQTHLPCNKMGMVFRPCISKRFLDT